MSPRRITGNGDPFDQALLRAGRNDRPARGAERRALAGLGLSVGLATRSAVLARPEGLSTARWGWTLKVLAIAMTVSAGAAGVWIGAERRPAHAPVRTTVANGSTPTAPVTAEIAAQEPSPASPPAVRTPEPILSSVRRARRSPSIAPSPNAVSGSTPTPASVQAMALSPPPLSVEIALVQQAARALASGDAGVALSLLDTYDKQCPNGALAEEAGALRVQALARNDRAAESTALARRLLDAHPHGVLAPRLQGVLDGAPDAGRR